MNEIYVVEFKQSKTKTKIVKPYTGEEYYHTGMIVQANNKHYFCDLAYRPGDKHYKIVEIKEENFYDFFKSRDEKVDIVKIPRIFTEEQAQDVLQDWKDMENEKYSIKKLASQWNTKIIMKICKQYYKITGKPYTLKMDQPGYTCAIRVDHVLKNRKTQFDAFPKYSERIAYPGLFIRRFKKYKI